MNKKEISVFIAGSCNSASEEREGFYAAELRYKDKSKFIGRNLINTTSNRVIIQGLIDIVKMLKEPCRINVYTAGGFGYRKMYTKQGEYKNNHMIVGINKDLLKILQTLLIENGHILIDNRSNNHTKILKDAYMKYRIKMGN